MAAALFDRAEACNLIASGLSLRKVADELNLSSPTRILDLADSDPSFAEQYTRAMELRADYHAAYIEDLAAKAERGEIKPDAARVAIDARKWVAAKLRPKRYGDRIEHEVNVTERVMILDARQVSATVLEHAPQIGKDET